MGSRGPPDPAVVRAQPVSHPSRTFMASEGGSHMKETKDFVNKGYTAC